MTVIELAKHLEKLITAGKGNMKVKYYTISGYDSVEFIEVREDKETFIGLV